MKEKKSVFLDKWILPVARGWEHQVLNAPLVNYNFTYEAMLWKPGRLLEIIGGATGKAGTMTTSAGAFTYIRAGFFNPYFGNRNLPVAARRRFQFYINPTGPGYKCRGVSISAFCFIFAP